jgi:hypothetical protein
MSVLAWLFIRGGQSVRIVRDPGGPGLDVQGPGTEYRRHDFSSEDELLEFQRTFEQRLAADGWELRASHERRGSDRRGDDAAPERRRRRSD